MTIETGIQLLSMLGAVATFAWGVYQYVLANRNQAESRRIEATKPFLERQLKLYTEATQAAALLSTSEETPERATAVMRFWTLYWGELALVENKDVEAAMVELGQGLENHVSSAELRQLSLSLAHACRDSLALSWGVKDWQNPHSAKAREH